VTHHIDHTTGFDRSSHCVSDSLDRHLEFRKELEVVISGSAQRGQVVANDYGVDSAKETIARTEVAQSDLASASKAQHRSRHGQAERSNG
jgi:hypothetical protein